jgi:hypothetical protein
LRVVNSEVFALSFLISGMTGTRNIVWIASYPKSGNTWLRFMLCNLLYGKQSSAAALNQLIPDVHELPANLPERGAGGLLKTHFMHSAALPLERRTAACIYIVRHPADVLVSNFHYAVRAAAGSEPSQAALDRYVDEFIAHRGDPRWTRLGMGTWEGNIESWLGRRHDFPVKLLRYEDIQQDPRRTCEALSQWLGAGSTPERIEEAVAHSSFASMQAIEASDIEERRVGIFYKPYLEASIRTGRRFMRRGLSGDGAGSLSGTQQVRLTDVFRPLLRELRYLDATR